MRLAQRGDRRQRMQYVAHGPEPNHEQAEF
jgi:hypothetical protein